MYRKIIYPGTFDPITYGHLDLIQRGYNFCDELIIAVADTYTKQTLFSLQERIAMVKETVQKYDRLKVLGFKGLLVDFAKEHNTNLVLRGLRAVSDFEFEFQLAIMNRHLDKEIETLFLTPNEKYTFISSSIVKEVGKLNGELSQFVPSNVQQKLRKKFNLT